MENGGKAWIESRSYMQHDFKRSEYFEGYGTLRLILNVTSPTYVGGPREVSAAEDVFLRIVDSARPQQDDQQQLEPTAPRARWRPA